MIEEILALGSEIGARADSRVNYPGSDAGFFKNKTIGNNSEDRVSEEITEKGMVLTIRRSYQSHIEKVTLQLTYWPNKEVTAKKVIKEIQL